MIGNDKPDKLLGSLIKNRYRVESFVGKSSLGDVYRAMDTQLKRAVALKVIAIEHVADSEMRARFLREARAAAAIVHPNVAILYDVLDEDEAPLLIMELVEGSSLSALVMSEIPYARKLEWLLAIARGLDALHQGGYVHRDVKASNVVITASDQPKLLELGGARPIHPTGTQELHQTTGTILDPAIDQLGWATIAAEILAPLGPATSAEVEAVITRAKSPSGFASMKDLIVALEQAIQGPQELIQVTPYRKRSTRPPSRTRTLLFFKSVAVVVGLGAIVIAAFLLSFRKKPEPAPSPSAPTPTPIVSASTRFIPAERDEEDTTPPPPPPPSASSMATPRRPLPSVRSLKGSLSYPYDLSERETLAWLRSRQKDLLPCFQAVSEIPNECMTAKWFVRFDVDNGQIINRPAVGTSSTSGKCAATQKVVAPCIQDVLLKHAEMAHAPHQREGRSTPTAFIGSGLLELEIVR